MVSISASERFFAFDLYSGVDVGIHPTSGVDGDRRCSRVVLKISPQGLITVICSTLLGSRSMAFTFTIVENPSFV